MKNKADSQKSEKSKGRNKLHEYLKKGRFDYSLDSKSNSLSNKGFQEIEEKKRKR